MSELEKKLARRRHLLGDNAGAKTSEKDDNKQMVGGGLNESIPIPISSPDKKDVDKESMRSCIEKKELLGKGSFGSVYRGYLTKTLEENSNPKQSIFEESKSIEVAIKIVSYNGDLESNDIGRELYFLKTLKNPFIVNYFSSFLYHGELWIIMEYCDAGSLLDFYRATKTTLNEQQIKAVVTCW
jgi:serine/threonine protein kinase